MLSTCCKPTPSPTSEDAVLLRCVGSVLAAETPADASRVLCRMSLRLASTEEVALALQSRLSAFKLEDRFSPLDLLHLAATTAGSLADAGLVLQALLVFLDEDVRAWMKAVSVEAEQQLSTWGLHSPSPCDLDDVTELESPPAVTVLVGAKSTLKQVMEELTNCALGMVSPHHAR